VILRNRNYKLRKVVYIGFLVFATSCAAKKSANSEVSSGFGEGKHKLDHKQEIIFKTLFHEANKFLVIEDYKKAFDKFNEAALIYPECAACYYQLSGLYEFQGQTSLAISTSKKSVELNPQNTWFLLQLSYLYQRNGKHKEAVESFKNLVAISPNSAEYYFPLAESQLHLGNNKEALATFEAAEKIIGESAELSMQKHRLYLEIGQSDKAILELTRLIDAHPDDVALWGVLAELYEEIGEIERALETYEKILDIEPQNGLVRLSLYDYYRYHGNSKRAKEELRIAMASKDVPIDSKLQIMLNFFSESEGNLTKRKEAYDYLEIMSVVNSDESKTHTVYGDFLYREGKASEALKKYRRAVELEPDHYSIWNQIMLIEFENQLNEDLLIDSKKALELYPTQPEVYYFQGHANMQLKHFEQAIESFNTGKGFIVDNDMLNVEYYNNLGQAYRELKQHQKSDESFELALILDPRNALILNNYSYYLSLRKTSLERAEEMSKSAIEIMPENTSFLDTYGWILFQQEKFMESEKWLSKAIDLGGSNSGTILEHYGDVLSKINRVEEAVEFWIKAKEIGGTTNQIENKIQHKKYYE
jgi:tetratricopeptide (TPR) repeat protein